MRRCVKQFSSIIWSNSGIALRSKLAPLQSYPRHLYISALRLEIVQFKLSDIGEGINEVVIKEWYVKPGDKVAQFDSICEVQSDKASVTITSRYDGIVKRLYYAVDDVGHVGKPLVDIELQKESAEPASEYQESVQLESGEESSGLDNIILTPKPVPARAEAKQTSDPAHATPSSEQHVTTPLSGQREASASKPLATPAVRQLAMEHQIDLTKVSATGRDGRVLKEDVLNYIAAAKTPPKETKPTKEPDTKEAAAKMPSAAVGSKLKEDRVVNVKGLMKVMVKTMTESLKIPHFGYKDEVDLTELVTLRRHMSAAVKHDHNVKLSYLPFFIKAASLALHQYPSLNAVVNGDCTQVTHKAAHNISIAMDTADGLIVPNVKHCEQLSVLEIAAELNRLQEAALKGRLRTDDLADGTFSLSNIGAIGGTYANPVIYAPQVAIGALGRMQSVPRFDAHGNVVPRQLMHVSWAADHRVVDGATMARFGNAWKRYLELPGFMLLHLH